MNRLGHKCLLVGFLALAFLPRSAMAQGAPPSCFDPVGNPVPAFADPNIPDVAFATVRAPFGPVILYQPSILGSPTPLQYFTYFHECAHHALGDILRLVNGFPPRPAQETDADCASMVMLAQNYGMTQSNFNQITQVFAFNPARPPLYPPGPVRVQMMVSCLQMRGIQLPPP